MNRLALVLCLMTSLNLTTVHAALDPTQPLADVPPYSLFKRWAAPVTPFEMAPNVWYVGTENLSSLLLTTPQGHVLIDAALDESAPQIKRNIESLGFHLDDIRYILNSHARLDQAGGIARLKAWSGAKVVASEPNARQMRQGGKGDFALGDALPFPPVQTDILVKDGQRLHLGGLTLTALLTPGHLPGATSWRVSLANGQTLIYADSLATPGYPLVNNKNYPTLINDIRHSFTVLAAQRADIFVANKGERFALTQKIAALAKGNKKAFYDEQGLKRYVEQSQARFEKKLAEQVKK